MRHFYYFSKKSLKYVEIRNFNRKFLVATIFISLIISFLIFGSYIFINNIFNPGAEVESLKNQNKELTHRISLLSAKFNSFNKELDSLLATNNQLRLKTNLTPVDYGKLKLGTGGSVFGEIPITSSIELSNILKTLSATVDEIDSRITFEKNNYDEIEETFNINSKLYDDIPAVKPAKGSYGDRFGMRMHPILKIKRMHNGIDILSDIGTPVYAPGGGKVVFTGRKGGYGRTVEIDHGFGYRTLYSHLSKIKVKKGQRVKRGDLIALTGNSGKLSTGPHLHYEIRHNGIALNPRNFIYDDVKLFELVSKK